MARSDTPRCRAEFYTFMKYKAFNPNGHQARDDKSIPFYAVCNNGSLVQFPSASEFGPDDGPAKGKLSVEGDREAVATLISPPPFTRIRTPPPTPTPRPTHHTRSQDSSRTTHNTQGVHPSSLIPPVPFVEFTPPLKCGAGGKD